MAATPESVSTAAATGAASTPAVAPARDNRFKMLDATIKRHRQQPDALLEVLHTAQELFGYLDRDTLTYVGRTLRVPPSRVFGGNLPPASSPKSGPPNLGILGQSQRPPIRGSANKKHKRR